MPEGTGEAGGMPQGDMSGGEMPEGGFSGGEMPEGGFSGGEMPEGGFSGGEMPEGGFSGGEMPEGGFPGRRDAGGRGHREKRCQKTDHQEETSDHQEETFQKAAKAEMPWRMLLLKERCRERKRLGGRKMPEPGSRAVKTGQRQTTVGKLLRQRRETSMVEERLNQEQIILTQGDVEDIERYVEGISGATISYSAQASIEGAELTSAKNYTVAGVKESYAAVSKLVLKEGSFLTEGDDDTQSRVCVVRFVRCLRAVWQRSRD